MYGGSRYGQDLGLAHDSGWAHLSHGQGESPLSQPQEQFGLERIAEATADEMFGRRGRRASFRAGMAVGRRQQRRFNRRQQRWGSPGVSEYERAGWGSAAWQAGMVPGQEYAPGGPSVPMGPMEDPYAMDQSDMEADALLAEMDQEDSMMQQDYDSGYGPEYGPEYGADEEDDEYGEDEDEDFGEDDEDFGEDDEEDEFGYWGRGRGRGMRPMRQARRRFRRRAPIRRARRQRRRMRRARSQQGQMAPYPERRLISGPAVAKPMQQLPPRPWEEQQQMMPMQPGYPIYGAAPVAQPPQDDGAFSHSLKVGLGLGLGFMGVALGVSLLARGFK